MAKMLETQRCTDRYLKVIISVGVIFSINAVSMNVVIIMTCFPVISTFDKATMGLALTA